LKDFHIADTFADCLARAIGDERLEAAPVRTDV